MLNKKWVYSYVALIPANVHVKPTILTQFTLNGPKQLPTTAQQHEVNLQQEHRFTANFYPSENKLYSDNICSILTNSMSGQPPIVKRFRGIMYWVVL